MHVVTLILESPDAFSYSDFRVLSSQMTPTTLISVLLDVSGDSNVFFGHQMHLATQTVNRCIPLF